MKIEIMKNYIIFFLPDLQLLQLFNYKRSPTVRVPASAKRLYHLGSNSEKKPCSVESSRWK
jgi:hypothetical protein